ncbi:MAG: Uma2 family endonuclease [Planctomycetes bacterium]|nr:Uma2 family endonuclease [Planctomycetota bacterium]
MSTANLPMTNPAPDSIDVTADRIAAELEALLPNIELIETDGLNMDSDWHRLNIELLLASIRFWFRDRQDYYAAGNSFIYYSKKQARNRDFKGPDFYFINGASRDPIRDYWAVWEEDGLYPHVIIELLSPTTANEDLSKKKVVYEQTFRTPNYFCFDRLTRELIGWNLEHTDYVRLPLNEQGRLWSDQLGLWVGPWDGEFNGYRSVWLRFYDADGKLVPTFEEFEAERAVAEAKRAEAEAKRADVERQRAIAEKERADAAELEIARLKELLLEKGGKE